MDRTKAGLAAVALAVVAITVVPAHANFHIMKVSEIFAGTSSDNTVQFVELQLYAAGQSQVQGHPVRVYDAFGTVVGIYTFAGPVANGANGAKILVATAQAQSAFGITADLLMTTASIPASGGAVCFDTVDCASWGNYAGTTHTSAPGAAFNPSGGIPAGQSMERKAGTDANNSATDFQLAAPTPTNNAGQSGQPSGTPQFTADTYQTTETAGSVLITASRNDASQAITVNYATQDGTATSGQDYTAVSGSLAYSVTEAAKSFNVPILDDGVTDAEEQFTVKLSDGSSTIDTATVLICGNLPSAPRNLMATASGQTTINLSWQAPVCAGDSPVSSYVIYEASSPNPTTPLTSVSGTSYSRGGLAPSSTRYYKVAAVNGTGESAKSLQAQATTAANDTQNPTVTFTSPANSVIVGGMPPVGGTAHDDVAVASVSASAFGVVPTNSVTGPMSRSVPVACAGCGTKDATFTVLLGGLPPGPYTIRVTVKDPSNKTGQADIVVVFVS